MGFYGNISNTNKTAFSFDRVYATRYEMDQACATDGVFIGRYVLVEYDEPPISAYYNTDDGLFYNTSYYGLDNVIREPKNNQIYLDISQDHSANPFYMWDADAAPTSQYFSSGAYVKVTMADINSTSPRFTYTARYNSDVTRYGRGYDSTAWRKTYDVEKNEYKYVLISELNTIVPNFHLIPDAPSNIPAAPYFDRDTTTNLDYYLHDQAAWGQSIRNAQKEVKYEIDSVDESTGVITYKPMKDRLDPLHVLSDETVTRMVQTWSEPDAFGSQQVDAINEEDVTGDIYYNKAGFNREWRSLTPQENGASQFDNTINYEIDHSGRRYYDTVRADGSMVNGITKSDMMEWYIHLPILGDAICELWDNLYGYDKDVDPTDSHLSTTEKAHRYTDLARSRGDVGGNGRYVTYDTSYAIGAINQIRDMMGYTIKNLVTEEQNGVFTKIDNSVITIADAIQETDVAIRAQALATAVNNIQYTFESSDTQWLYYTLDPSGDEQILPKEHFYAYAYYPRFEQVQKDTDGTWYYLTDSTDITTKRSFADDQLFYLDDDNIFKRVNKSNYGIIRSDGELVRPIAQFYAPMARWKLMELPRDKEDSLYGLITELHELLGNDNPDLRSFDTITGCINIIKDLVGNIDTQLEPHRLLMTNDHGQITHMRQYDGTNFGNSTEYPYFNSVDNQELLDCGGHWRLPIDYKLEDFTLNINNQYFDSYWGNSTYHELIGGKAKNGNYDTIGDAFYKVSEELSDIQYNALKRIVDFYVEDGSAITGANVQWHCKYDLHTPWNGIYYTIDNGARQTIAERTNNQEYLTNSGITDFVNTVTMGTNDIVITLYLVDERSVEISQSLTIKYLENYKYAVTTATTNPTLGTAQKLYNEQKNKFTLGADEYLYIQVPSASYRLFIDNQYGGFDLFDDANHIYRTTNTSLGTIEVEIYE